MSAAGTVHIDLVHRLFKNEISADELLDTVPWAVEDAEGQLVLPDFKTGGNNGGD